MQILQHRSELLVEIVEALVLIHVQVQKMTKRVVVTFKLKDTKPIVQCLQHLLRSVLCGRKCRANTEYILHHFFC